MSFDGGAQVELTEIWPSTGQRAEETTINVAAVFIVDRSMVSRLLDGLEYATRSGETAARERWERERPREGMEREGTGETEAKTYEM
jgi:hypothetical protein